MNISAPSAKSGSSNCDLYPAPKRTLSAQNARLDPVAPYPSSFPAQNPISACSTTCLPVVEVNLAADVPPAIAPLAVNRRRIFNLYAARLHYAIIVFSITSVAIPSIIASAIIVAVTMIAAS